MFTNEKILELVQLVQSYDDKILEIKEHKTVDGKHNKVRLIPSNTHTMIMFFNDNNEFLSSMRIAKDNDERIMFIDGNCVLYTQSQYIKIDGNHELYSTDPEIVFSYSTILSSLKYQYYQLIKLLKDNKIKNSVYIHIKENNNLNDSDFKEFIKLFKRIIK